MGPGPVAGGRAGRLVTDAAGRPLAVRARTPEAAVAVPRKPHLVPRGPHPATVRGAAPAPSPRMAARAGLLVPRLVVPRLVALGRQTRVVVARPRVDPAPVSSVTAPGASPMTTPAAAGVRRPVVLARPLGPRRPGRPAVRPGLHQAGRVGLRATADAIAGRLLGTTVPLRLVTEPAGRNARTDPRGGTGPPGRARRAPAPTDADRDPRTGIPTAPVKGPVLAVPAPVPGTALAGLPAVTRGALAAGARGPLLAVLRIGPPAAKMARPRGLLAAAPGRQRRGTAAATAVMTAAVRKRHGRPAGAQATGRRNAPAAGGRGPGRTSGAGVRSRAARSRRTSRARAARMSRIRSALTSSIPMPAPS